MVRSYRLGSVGGGRIGRRREKLPAPTYARGMNRSVLSIRSVLSTRSIHSMASVRSILSAASIGSILSLGSAGSMLSVGSAGSILSVGSAGSILSLWSAGSILSIRSRGKILCIDDRPVADLDSSTRTAIGVTAVAAVLGVAAVEARRLLVGGILADSRLTRC